MSSGNGGTYSDYLGTNYPGGKGVEAIGGGQLYAVPPNGRLDFYVGANGNDYFYAYSSAPADPYASPEVVKAPVCPPSHPADRHFIRGAHTLFRTQPFGGFGIRRLRSSTCVLTHLTLATLSARVLVAVRRN